MSATANTRTRRSRYAPVNAVVHCGYWREDYTVVSHNDDGSVTVRWHGREDYPSDTEHPAGRLGTHRTPFDPRLDRIITQPAVPGTPLTDAIDEALAALERAYPEMDDTHDVLVPDPDYGPAAASYCLHDVTARVRALRDALRDGGAHA
jgi:hypothetical protein